MPQALLFTAPGVRHTAATGHQPARRAGRQPRLGLAVLLIGAIGILTACTNAPAGSTDPAASPAGSETIVVEAYDFGFRPASLTFAGDRPVRLELANLGAVEHDWTVDGLNQGGRTVDSGGHGAHSDSNMMAGTVHVSAQAGQRDQVEFTPKPGTYEYYCSVPGHRESGMRGTLTVN